jgi:hypothetical protein
MTVAGSLLVLALPVRIAGMATTYFVPTVIAYTYQGDGTCQAGCMRSPSDPHSLREVREPQHNAREGAG